MQAIAEQYFPPLEAPSGAELPAQDATGGIYTLRFRYDGIENADMPCLSSCATQVLLCPSHLTLPLFCAPSSRFWVNNQSRMYLLEGTAELQQHYHLRMGDVLIFAQKGDGTIVLAGRPPTKADLLRKPAVRRPSPGPGGRLTGRAAVVRTEAECVR